MGAGRRWGAWVVAGAVVLATLGVAALPKASAWDLRVGTRTKLTATVRAQGTRVTVEGFLRDNVGQGVSGQGISLDFTPVGRGAVGVVRRDAVTDRTGRFAVALTLPAGAHKGRVMFSGQEHYFEAAAIDLGVVQTARGAATLSIAAPPVALRSRGRVAVTLGAVSTPAGASSPEPVQGLRLALSVDGGPPVEVETGPAGAAVVTVDVSEVSGPSLALRARLVDTRDFREAEAAAEVRVLGPPTLTLEAEAVRARLERGLRASGTLADRYGGAPNLPVELRVEHQGQEAARLSATTDADGGWELFIPEDQLPEGRLTVAATSRLGEGDAAQAPPVEVAFRRTGLGRTPWVIGGALALALLGAGALAARDAWRRRQAAAAARPTRVTLQKARAPGLAAVAPAARPAGVAAADLDGLAGQLIDTLTEAPIPGAQLLLRRPDAEDPELETTSGEDGSFHLEGLPAGRWVLEARQRGYVAATHALTLPHRGELAWFRFALTPVRLVVRDLYAALLEDLARDGVRWGRMTPRQIHGLLVAAVATVTAHQGLLAPREGIGVFEASLERLLTATQGEGEALSGEAMVEVLTHLIEEVYFSQRAYGEDLITVAERLAAALRQEARRQRRGDG